MIVPNLISYQFPIFPSIDGDQVDANRPRNVKHMRILNCPGYSGQKHFARNLRHTLLLVLERESSNES